MAKKGKKRIRQTKGTVSRASQQAQSAPAERRAWNRRYTLWSIGGLIVIAVIAVAWIAFQNISHSSSTSSSNGQSLASSQSSKTGNSADSLSGGPQINFPETEFDFGTIAQGEKVSHTFVVRNTGNAPLRLIKAAGS